MQLASQRPSRSPASCRVLWHAQPESEKARPPRHTPAPHLPLASQISRNSKRGPETAHRSAILCSRPCDYPAYEFIVRGAARKRSGITVVDWIEPKPVVRGPDDHALIAIVEASHGVTPAKLAMTGIVRYCSKLHCGVSPIGRVPATAFEQYARLACIARFTRQL
jgi:hypothetical protein